MKEVVNFLRAVYYGSVVDIANILTAEADGNKEILRKYLQAVKEYIDSLLQKL